MTEGTSTTSNDTMIRDFLAAWERRDTEHIVDHFTDDGVYHSIPLAPIVGKQAIPRSWPDSPTCRPGAW
jgi:ketosteroid isomerase-like protein